MKCETLAISKNFNTYITLLLQRTSTDHTGLPTVSDPVFNSLGTHSNPNETVWSVYHKAKRT